MSLRKKTRHFFHPYEEGTLVVPRHIWRWRALAVWVIAFTLLLMVLLTRQNTNIAANKDRLKDISQILLVMEETKAEVSSLKRTNCGLRRTMLQAAKTADKAKRKEAAAAYRRLADLFSPSNCNVVDQNKNFP